MWKSSLRKQSHDTARVTVNQNLQQAYNIDWKSENEAPQRSQNRSMSAQRNKRNSTPHNQIDLLRVEEILRGRDPESQLSQSLRMKTEDKEQKFAKHLNQVEEINQKYFRHLKGNCKCGKCTCCRCKCNLRKLQPDYKRLNRSLYQADFQPKITEVPQPFVLDRDNFKNSSKIEMRTTQRTDYIPKKSVDPKKECGYLDRNSILCGQQAIDHNTLYKNNFNIKKITPNVLFTHEPIEYMRVPHDKIKQKITSESRSNYRQPQESLLPSQLNEEGKNFVFVNFAHDRQKNLKPPISMDDRMSSQTTARDFFKGIQPEKTIKSSNKLDSSAQMRNTSSDPYNQEFVKTKNEWVHIFNNQQFPNHQGQFMSSKTQSFYPKNLNQTCEGWKEPDDIDRLPRSAYMYSYA